MSASVLTGGSFLEARCWPQELKVSTCLAAFGMRAVSAAEKNALVNEDETGFWSAETKRLKRLTATDAGFRDFFTAYAQFEAIRASEEFKDPEDSSNIEVRLSGLPEDVLAGKDSNVLSEKQKYNEWVGGFEDEMEKQLEQKCSCEVTVTVIEVTPVNRRRSLLATSADIKSRASGSSADNSKKVTDEINSSKSFSIGDKDYTASNAKASQAETPETPSTRVVEKTEGMHDGGVAGIDSLPQPNICAVHPCRACITHDIFPVSSSMPHPRRVAGGSLHPPQTREHEVEHLSYHTRYGPQLDCFDLMTPGLIPAHGGDEVQ
eukprot:1154279-Pelagomonas_calceolata.AAC.2